MGQQQQQRAKLTGVVYANAAAQLMKMIYVSSAHQANNTADIDSASSLYHDYVSLHFYHRRTMSRRPEVARLGSGGTRKSAPPLTAGPGPPAAPPPLSALTSRWRPVAHRPVGPPARRPPVRKAPRFRAVRTCGGPTRAEDDGRQRAEDAAGRAGTGLHEARRPAETLETGAAKRRRSLPAAAARPAAAQGRGSRGTSGPDPWRAAADMTLKL